MKRLYYGAVCLDIGTKSYDSPLLCFAADQREAREDMLRFALLRLIGYHTVEEARADGTQVTVRSVTAYEVEPGVIREAAAALDAEANGAG